MATVTPLGNGAYRVDDEGRQRLVYVAGSEGDVWAFCDGGIYRERDRKEPPAKAGRYVVNAPMPATVVKVLVVPGQTVRQTDTLLVLEAMKMELPIRAPSDGVVKAVNCREGELVQPDRALVELE
jgi:acetyl/propionyl-CoA carboxylase alpha subunit